MRVPLSWLQEYVDLPAAVTGRLVAERLIAAGLEVETVHEVGAGLSGPLLVGRVEQIEELTGFRKPIRFCQVDLGPARTVDGAADPDAREHRGIICGARNFATGDKVVVALPGAVLPGDFVITARETYGHISDGMICSAREIGMGDEHNGIIVLPEDTEVGADAIAVLGLRDEVLDIAVTTDRGYCLSIRGIAREVATAFGATLRDPALLPVPAGDNGGYPVIIEAPGRDGLSAGCDAFVARTVRGIDPLAPSPLWLQRRVQMAGMRPVSLIVDIANYVMLELGQPLHTYDERSLTGAIVVRRARAGETLETLDGVKRKLDPEDVIITDSSGPIGLAGVMGGGSTEIQPATSDVVIEAAHFDPIAVARTARRHKLNSEAAYRFSRGVDPLAARAAAQRAVDLLVLLGGGTAVPGVTEIAPETGPTPITIDAAYPGRVAGMPYSRDTVVRWLQEVGCAVEGSDTLTVVPPSWRPDLTDPNDLVEEVIRLEGYDLLPSTLPRLPAGHGYTLAQRARRRVGTRLADAGYVETLCYPFVGQRDFDALGLAADDPRRAALRLVNPLSEEQPLLRTTLLPGLLAALRRNVGRGEQDVALFELGMVFQPRAGGGSAPLLGVAHRPSDEELVELEAALPNQPRHLAVVLCGRFEPAGWWGSGRAADWSDAIEAARLTGVAAGVELTVRQAERTPWHPGRCAVLLAGDEIVGYAGELHPRVVGALDLPARACAAELDLDAIIRHGGGLVEASRLSTFPVATQDVALTVPASVPAADVADALRTGAGELLESLRLFDVYTGDQIAADQRSLAFTLRFRAPDRTLTAAELAEARAAAIREAAERTGAVLRGA
jgi:phenylalanyl-tRNA synthetase beta chain